MPNIISENQLRKEMANEEGRAVARIVAVVKSLEQSGFVRKFVGMEGGDIVVRLRHSARPADMVDTPAEAARRAEIADGNTAAAAADLAEEKRRMAVIEKEKAKEDAKNYKQQVARDAKVAEQKEKDEEAKRTHEAKVAADKMAAEAKENPDGGNQG